MPTLPQAKEAGYTPREARGASREQAGGLPGGVTQDCAGD